MQARFRFDQQSNSSTSDISNENTFVGPAAHWSRLRRHATPDALADKARNYILEMLSKDPPRQAAGG